MDKNIGAVALNIATSLGAGNFLWQLIRLWVIGTPPDWEFASAITFFQCSAIGYMWWRLRK